MAKLQIGDKVIEVDDSFLKLSPQDQQKTVDEIERSLGGSAPQQTAPVQEQPSTGMDMIKGFGAGVAQGTIALPGGFGDVAKINSDLLSGGVKYLGAPQWAQDATGMAGRAMMGPLGMMPTSDQITQQVGRFTGPMYEAKTVPGQYAQTVGQFAPSALLGPGKMSQKIAMGLGGALASETGGQLTKGTKAEPYARLGGALLGGALGAKLGAGKQPVAEAPTTEQLRATKNALYDSAETGIGKVKMTRTHVERLAQAFNEVGRDTNKGGVLSDLTDSTYKQTNSIISKFNDITGDVQAGRVPPPTFGELEKFRESLNATVSDAVLPTGKLSADGAMASRLVDKIDDFLIETPFKEARTAYRTMIKAEKIERAFQLAELNAGANYTQAGIEKAIQGQFRRIAADKNFAKLFTAEEQAAIESVVKIGGVHKFMKRFGALAPSGALSTMFNIGAVSANPVLGIPLGLGASAAKYGSTAKTLNNARMADEMIRRGGQVIPKTGLLNGNIVPRLGLLGVASQAGNH